MLKLIFTPSRNTLEWARRRTRAPRPVRRLGLERLEERSLLATFVVNMDSTAGNGAADGICDSDRQTPGEQCTFFAALYTASFLPGPDTIMFAIRSVDLGTFSPNLSGQLTIDGNLGDGTLVEIDGDIRLFSEMTVTNVRLMGSVLLFSGSNGATIRGNTISGQVRYEADSDGHHILNNRIFDPVGIDSLYDISNNEIKGNTILGGGGIVVRNGAGNFIEDNVVLGTRDDGFSFHNGAGITLGVNSTGIVVRGNFVGVDPLINEVMPLDGPGLSIGGTNHTAVGNTVGGSLAGIALVHDGRPSGGHQVQGNFIGTDSKGMRDLGNRGLGIVVSSSGNTIGGPNTEDGNTIAFNDQSGVGVFGLVFGTPATRNRIQGNRIFNNGGEGISLGHQPNDPGDVDEGPNNLQNSPEVNQACDGRTRISLSSMPGKPFVIDYYSNPSSDPTDYEGHTYLGSRTVMTDSKSGEITFDAHFSTPMGHTLSVTATDEDGNTSEFSALRSRDPVFLLPGIGGTFATSETHADWIVNRGVSPETLQIDPIGLVYKDLIQTLRNVGYQEGKDLYIVNYDWRVPPAPNDGTMDGHIDGLLASEISLDRASGEYRHGVDYLGRALRLAAETWGVNCAGLPLDSVDVIAHSTGGLVTRAYIQSDAYHKVYEGTKRLPSIDQFIMVDVPNQGASKPWNPIHDDWGYDLSYRFLSNFAEAAYRKLANGKTIHGPDYEIRSGTGPDEERVKFVDARIVDGEPTRDLATTSRFINLYIPTLRTLLATYDFIDNDVGPNTNVNGTADRNWLALDLNGGSDINGFATSVGKVIAVYGDGETTPTTVTREVCTGTFCPDRYSILDSYFDNDRLTGEEYWVDNTTTQGDETVPRVSLFGQFENDPRVIESRWDKGENTNDGVKHTEIVMNRDVQKAILGFLETDFRNEDISYDSQRGATGLDDGYALIVDPVEAILTDASGKRLGYSRATGVLAEIPNSLYLGQADGMGFVFGAVAMPLQLTMTGLGEGYFVELSGSQDGAAVEFEASGILAVGAVESHEIQSPSTVSWQNPTNPVDVNNDGIVAPLDALLAINELTNRQFSDPATGRLQPITSPPDHFLDVNGDGFLAPLDALLVINELPSSTLRQPAHVPHALVDNIFADESRSLVRRRTRGTKHGGLTSSLF